MNRGCFKSHLTAKFSKLLAEIAKSKSLKFCPLRSLRKDSAASAVKFSCCWDSLCQI
jgi:hypothetical protein